jgi:hypothetical protein
MPVAGSTTRPLPGETAIWQNPLSTRVIANRGTLEPRLLSFTRLLFGHGERTAKDTVALGRPRMRVKRLVWNWLVAAGQAA